MEDNNIGRVSAEVLELLKNFPEYSLVKSIIELGSAAVPSSFRPWH